MPVTKSSVAEPILDASIPTSTLKKLEVAFSNEAAQKPDKLNLWIGIDINLDNGTALFHCKPPESVGTHKKRKVTYCATENCLLKFVGGPVFTENPVPLIKNTKRDVKVNDEASDKQANYEVYVQATEIEESMGPVAYLLTGPHIVVP
jgi:hypothetical protein